MKELNEKTVVISGGAEGIGLGIAKVLGSKGMNVVLADIDQQQLQRAEESLQDLGVPVLALVLDASDLAQWEMVAQRSSERFGKIHMLVNNAGVSGTPASIENADQKDWRWVIDVNLMGVANGAQVMVPLMVQHGEGGWLINVASMAGFSGVPLASPYSATKAAVVSMSESWHAELSPHNIHVSVLCPGFVKTRINSSQRNKQLHYGADKESQSPVATGISDMMKDVIDSGMAPEVVAERLLEAIEARELYVFTHPNYRALVKARFTAIDQAFERAQSSSLLTDDVVPDIPGFG